MTLPPVPRALRRLFSVIVIQMSVVAVAVADDAQSVAGPVGADTAAIVARQHLARLGQADACTVGDVRELRDAEADRILCYCFDLLPRGYIIVAGDTALPPVIAYAFENDAGCDLAPGNPLADVLQWDLHRRFAHAVELPADVAARQRAAWAAYLNPGAPRGGRFEQWPPAGTTPTGGWLLTNWTQSAPYNNLCPMDLVAGARSIAGCPAVAMAQILNYHARLNGTTFADADDYYHSYGGNNFWIDNAFLARSFPSWPMLNTYLNTLFGNYFYGTTPTNTSKAALVYACGAAAHQVYSASGSGTFEVAQAFSGLQRFGCTTAELLVESDPDLETRIAANMQAAAPALLAVVNEAWTVGHNLVIDGYNTDNYYHLNFGWGGSYNGWYQLLVGLPYQLTVIEGVVVDILTEPCELMDCNCSGSVNWTDFTYFAPNLAGPGVVYTAPGCAAFDANVDGDVDLADFGAFQTTFGT